MPGTTPRGYPFPLYTDVADFPDNIQDLATAVDTDVQTNLVTAVNSGLNQPSVSAFTAATPQAVANATDVTMTFATEEYDNANWFNSGVSNTNFTVPSTGLYMISASLVYNDFNGTGGRTIIIKSNGVFVFAKTVSGVSYDITQPTTTNLIFRTAGDVITVVARQNSGVSMNVTDKRISINKVSS